MRIKPRFSPTSMSKTQTVVPLSPFYPSLRVEIEGPQIRLGHAAVGGGIAGFPCEAPRHVWIMGPRGQVRKYLLTLANELFLDEPNEDERYRWIALDAEIARSTGWHVRSAPHGPVEETEGARLWRAYSEAQHEADRISLAYRSTPKDKEARTVYREAFLPARAAAEAAGRTFDAYLAEHGGILLPLPSAGPSGPRAA